MKTRLSSKTTGTIARIFDRLDYAALGEIYCDHGGEAFWRARRGACRRLGVKLAEVLRRRLTPGGRAGIIVPAGVLFGGNKAARKFRELLLTECDSRPSSICPPASSSPLPASARRR